MQMGLQGPQDTSFYSMRTAVQQAIDIVKSDPGVDNVMGFTGGRGATNTGSGFVALKPLDERKVSATAIIERLRPKLAKVEGVNLFLQSVQDVRGVGLMQAMVPLAERAARLSAGPSNPHCHGGMSFTALRDASPLPPGRGARRYFVERFGQLADAGAALRSCGDGRHTSSHSLWKINHGSIRWN